MGETFAFFRRKSAARTWRCFVDAAESIPVSRIDYAIGFSYPETAGRWTEGHEAVLTLPVDACIGSNVTVRLVASPLFCEAKRQFSFEVCAAPGVTSTYLMVEAEPQAPLLVEAKVISTGAFHGAVLAFRLLDPVRPSALAMSFDTRLLGLFVKTIEVVAGDDPQPTRPIS